MEEKIVERWKIYSSNLKKGDFDYFKIGNDALYKLCAKNLEHKNLDAIISKLWLIGRSYAAALERRRNKKQGETLTGFYIGVAKKIQELQDFDENIKLLQNEKIDKTNIDKALSLHKKLTKIFKDTTGLDKRSLASKYLHFHCPNMFFLYDSRANNEINKLIDKCKDKLPDDADKQYARFYYKALELKRHIYKKYDTTLTTRDIDNLLVFIKE